MSQICNREFLFPDPRVTSADGLLCVGGDLSVETLLAAYSRGIFPWPQEGFPLLWFSPPKRGVLEFSKLHIAKSLRRFINKTSYELRVNTAFEEVIQECAMLPRKGQDGTWILPEMWRAYIDLHQAGYAHSFEIWQDNELVGGLYGVYIAGVFSGESMFFKKSNMSKVALVEAVGYLASHGLQWMDVQMVTEQLAAMGGEYIPRDAFLDLVDRSAEKDELHQALKVHAAVKQNKK